MKTKKNLIIGAVALSLVLVSSGAVFAQTETPDTPGRGAGIPIHASLHEYIVPAIAELFNMTEEEVASAFDSGSTFATLALTKGYAPEEIRDLHETVQAKAIELAVADGALSAEEAAWLQSVRFGARGRGNMNKGENSPCFGAVAGSAMRRGGRW